MYGSLSGGTDAVAIVTGGGFNIGRAVALRLAGAGARVVVAARQTARLDETVAAIEAAGGRGIAVETDVTKLAEVENLVARTVEHYGRVDIMVAAAGGGGAHAPIDEAVPGEWYDVIAKNLFSVFNSARCVLPVMRRQDRGVILSFTGGGAFFPDVTSYSTAYATAKAALCRFTDQLQAELLDTGIRVHCIEPGMVWNPEQLRAIDAEEQRSGVTHPQRTLHRSPDEAAKLAHFLASDAGAVLRGRVVSVNDEWWRDPDRVRAVEDTVHLYRLRRAEESP